MNIYRTPTGIQCGILLQYRLPEITGSEYRIQSALLPNFLKLAKDRINETIAQKTSDNK